MDSRERGLYERALKQGVAVECELSIRKIPMKKNVDDDTVDLADWPFLMPNDLESCLMFMSMSGGFLFVNRTSWAYPLE